MDHSRSFEEIGFEARVAECGDQEGVEDIGDGAAGGGGFEVAVAGPGSSWKGRWP